MTRPTYILNITRYILKGPTCFIDLCWYTIDVEIILLFCHINFKESKKQTAKGFWEFHDVKTSKLDSSQLLSAIWLISLKNKKKIITKSTSLHVYFLMWQCVTFLNKSACTYTGTFTYFVRSLLENLIQEKNCFQFPRMTHKIQMSYSMTQ